MLSGPPSSDGDNHRRQVRKGTRSCWECKRRKIRCQLSPGNTLVCAGCLARGTRCLGQEYVKGSETLAGGSNVGERLGRVEQLLETLVAKISAYEDEGIMTPESTGTDDVLTPYPSSVLSDAQIQETAPFLSLFNNTAFGRRENDQSQASTAVSRNSATTPRSRGNETFKIKRLRQTLVELLPSQKDADLVCNAAMLWLRIFSSTFVFEDNDSIPESIYDIEEVSKRHPTSIARTLLYIASCIQQLNPQFDVTQLELYPSVESYMERLISIVQALVTSDDELVSTTEGLECLMLLGSFHINAGNPRRAWLNFRRAMNIGQLMGLHREACSIPGGREMWYHTVQAERYLALVLGLPTGSADVGCGPEETFQNPDIDKDALFSRKLCDISGRIIERNQNEQIHSYTKAQEIDESLEKLAREMPPGWWDIPANIPYGDFKVSAAAFYRLMMQLWYFQLMALLHLPFMLRAATEFRYDYSKFSCMKASRQVIYRYLMLRSTPMGPFRCKIIDFGAFTAIVTLLLGLLEPVEGVEGQDERQQRDNDRDMVQKFLLSMEQLQHGPNRDLIAVQSANVIKSLLAIESPTGQSTSNLRLTIPYFGTISIVRPPSRIGGQSSHYIQPAIRVGEEITHRAWENTHYDTESPVSTSLISFASSQFHSLVPEHIPVGGWDIPGTDTMSFDSLFNEDLTIVDFLPQMG